METVTVVTATVVVTGYLLHDAFADESNWQAVSFVNGLLGPKTGEFKSCTSP